MAEWTMWRLPFFGPRHGDIGCRASDCALPEEDAAGRDLEPLCRDIALALGRSGLLKLVVPELSGGPTLDLRAICLAREALCYRSALADAVFAMQGIGSAALLMHGTAAQKQRYLPAIREGTSIAAFALTETRAGSDVGGIETVAHRDGSGFVIEGEKTLISNAPFADHYIVVARTGEAPGTRGLSAFMVDAGTPGLTCGDPIELSAPHPLGGLRFEGCRVSGDAMIGAAGTGFAVTMSTFNLYRTSVGAAALGLARRARDLALERVMTRKLFGAPMSQMDSVRTAIAEMEIALTTAALAVYSAAWFKDSGMGPGTREASIAKYTGTENGWAVVDAAVQLFGGQGVTRGCEIEKIFREARAMRIYEGASEVQKHIIGREVLRGLQGEA